MDEDPLRRIGGEWCYCVEAFVFHEAFVSTSDTPRVGLLALLCRDFQSFGKRGEATAIVQFYKLVIPGTILTRHVFKGLERPLLSDGNMCADEQKLVYTRKPAYDYEWTGGPQGRAIQRDALPGKVFSVIQTPNLRHREQFPEVDGWIETWGWVDEDQGLPEAPKGWVDRYKSKLWSRRHNE